MKKKSNKKSSFNKYNECGTIGLAYRVKRAVGKILLLCLTVFVFSVFICYLDCGSEALYLDDMSKELLVSQLQMKVYEDRFLERKEAEANVEEEEPELSEEVSELKTAKEESEDTVYEYTVEIKKAYLTHDHHLQYVDTQPYKNH